MKQRITVLFMILFLAFVPGGCGAKDDVYLEISRDDTSETEEGDGSGMPSEDAAQAEIKTFDTEVTQGMEQSDQTAGSGDSVSNTQAADEKGLCYVYVCGAVAEPGVYILPESSRIYEAISMAGGLNDEADQNSVNQADSVIDGQMIKIPTREEVLNGSYKENADNTGNTSITEQSTKEQTADNGLVDINQASVEVLMTLPGIGAAKADSIIAYREKCGGFSSVEELMSVDGIKEGVYNRIKDCIKVN